MKVELEKSFPMPAPPEAAWALLQDLDVVAGCMPGAKITERLDDRHYKGTVSVRVGPASMAFRGEFEVRELDASSKTLHLIGRGSDTTGSSGASMDLVARIEPAGEGSQLVGRSEVTVSGKAAAFGGRMMSTIADQILGQFARNFATELKARAAPATATPISAASINAAANAAPVSAAPANAAPVNAAAPSPATPPQAQAGTAFVGSGSPDPVPLPPGVERLSAIPVPEAVTPTTARANELSAFGLIWAVARDFVRGLFKRGPA